MTAERSMKADATDTQHPDQAGTGGNAAGEPAEKVSKLARQIARQLGDDSYSPAMITGFTRLFEIIGLSLCGIAVFLFYVLPKSGFETYYLFTTVAGALFAFLLFQLCDAYQVQSLRSVFRTLSKLILCWTITFATMTAVAFFLKIGAEYSRVWFGSWFLSGILFLFANRYFVAFAIRRWARDGTMERRAVIVGGGPAAEHLIRALEQQPDNDVRICGIFDDRSERRSPAIVAGYPKLGNVSELVEFARLARIDMLILSLPLTAEKRVMELLKKLWVLPVDIRLAAHSSELRFRPRAYSSIGSVRMLDIFDRPINDWDSVAKRMFDIVFSILGIIVFSPVMLATAIAVKATSRGPVFFTQKRHGFNNEVINVYKFRSMYADQSDPTARNAVTKNDPRVTPVGRFIRRTSIDELPQFFNALKGDLSLVGPRPHAVHAQSHDRMFAEVVDGYFARHRVKPGVTGWAQINGWRGEIDDDEKIKQRTAYDLYYIENWSLLFDLKILFLTPIRLFGSETAY
ncbi:undecaprenyl-phosphate glucose phosphotransferase [Nitratireductor sp. XY-223]|uniref:undecaprenyl-phosphate glucose phosphotransferase n=1 Tax=Nitratireductor sp. XY-223 TaxID=2561926 RepID=UPI001FEDCA6A|nr:undecaprenyl-phosphate glucose phosphotransferase [Nitratireductor sp. XY-223]